MMPDVSHGPATFGSNGGLDFERDHGDNGSRGREDLDVQQVGVGVWRVRNRRLPERDASCVLGVIEKTCEGFESIRVDRGLECSVSASFTAAVGCFSLEEPEHADL